MTGGVRLTVLTRDDCEQVRQWRNVDLVGLRTPYPLTVEMQARFYDTVICDRSSPHRYYAVKDGSQLVGQVGLVNIERENGRAEISLVTDPERRQQGYGRQAVDLILAEAFLRQGLRNVWGEVYQINPAWWFWLKVLAPYRPHWTTVIEAKLWEGEYWDAYHFTVKAERFRPAWMVRVERAQEPTSVLVRRASDG